MANLIPNRSDSVFGGRFHPGVLTHLFYRISRLGRLKVPLQRIRNTVHSRGSAFRITNASLGVRTVAIRQQSSFEWSSTSRYVWPARFWTLYVPDFNFPSTKMDIGSPVGEVCITAGNEIVLGLEEKNGASCVYCPPHFPRSVPKDPQWINQMGG